MHSNSTISINSNNYFSNDKIELTDESNQILIKDLKNSIDELDKEKLEAKKIIDELKEKIIDLGIINDKEKYKLLIKERDDLKVKASNSLSLCSKMAEELIILRDKLDQYKHINQK